MTTKTISTYIAAGYSLATNYGKLDITATGGIGGFGLQLHALTRVVNDGFIIAGGGSNGVVAYAAATIINGSADDQGVEIRGYSGVFAPNAAVTVSNFGSILGRGNYGNGVFLVAGGAVTNGAAGDTGATIYGVQSGVAASLAAKVINFGTVRGEVSDGVLLGAGGSVTNGAATDFRAIIRGGRSGVVSNAGSLTVVNFRTIQGLGDAGDGVTSAAGGTITNGAAGDTNAQIYGRHAGVELTVAGKVTNFGSITGHGANGVYLRQGGSLTNGSATDGRASVKGASGGVFAHNGSLTASNFGSITATASGFGVYMSGGVVTNGSTLATAALIEGPDGGVKALTASTTVTNFGVIDGIGSTISAGDAISLKAGGTVTNGAAGDTGALIEGGFGVFTQAGVTKVANFGTISAIDAVYLLGGGSVTNGSATDTTAAIIGHLGVGIRGALGTVVNFGTVIGYGDEWAVSLSQGTVTNGSATDPGALIEGGNLGVFVAGANAAVRNFGTILADLNSSGASAVYVDSVSVTNGSAADTVATIAGRYGVFAGFTGASTFTNFGTVHGFGGAAVYFSNSADVLNVEAGSVFIGAVKGGGGVLNLADGVGTLSGLTGAGTMTVSGSMATTTFQNFAVLEIGAGASFTDTGAVTVAAGQTIDAAGTLTLGGAGAASVVDAGLIETTGALTLAGAVTNTGTLDAAAGTLTVEGAVTGAGRVTIAKGTADFAGTFSEHVAFLAGATGVLELAHSTSYAGSISGFSKTGATSLDLLDIGFVSGITIASFSGTTTSGTLTVTDGTHTAKIHLTGNYTAATWTLTSDGHGGTTVVDPTAPTVHTRPMQPLVSAMAGFGGGAGATSTAPPTREKAPFAVLVRSV
jgi:hypothetical protein